MDNLKSFPKVELHRHLEGSLRLATLLDVASAAGVILPTQNLSELKEFACVTSPVQDLSTMLKKMSLMQSVLATPEIIERLAFEACLDAFDEGICLLELRYSPAFIKSGHENLDFEIIHEAVVNGVTHAERKLKGALKVGLIGIITREHSFKEASETTEFILLHQETFIGIDLAGDEAAYDAQLFTKFFDKAQEAGLGITVHSGEERREGGARAVRDAIEKLGASRIGHGVQISKDQNVIEYVKSKNVVLELCPSSNVLTHAVDNIEAHPFKMLKDQGVLVTLNSDDPTFFGIDLVTEYQIAAQHFGFLENDFLEINRVAAKSSFIPEASAVYESALNRRRTTQK